jgi:hypothetical protein
MPKMEPEQLYANILDKLTPEERVILKLREREQHLEAEKKVNQLEAEKNVNQLEAEKKVNQLEAEIKVNQLEKKLIQVQLDAKEKVLAQLNFEKLEKQGFIELRSFIDYYDRNYVNFDDTTSRARRFERFMQKHPTSMEKWGVQLTGFEKWFTNFYDKLNHYAHPFFQRKNTFSLAEGILEPKDITFIALLWDIAPLPKQNLYIEVDDVKKNLFKYYEK